MLTLDQVAEELQVNRAGVYAMVRRGELPALKLGGRGMWRVDRRDLETFIEQARDDTAKWIAEHPFVEGKPQDEDPAAG